MRRPLLFAMLMLCWLLPAANAAAANRKDDRVVISGSVLVDRAETVHDLVVVNGDVTIRGKVTGDVVVVDGDVTIRGSVAGDVVAVAGQATLGKRGRVAGDLVYGKDKPVLAPGSRVAGDVQKITLGDTGIVGVIGFWIGFTISLLLLGIVLLLLAPRAGDAIARAGRDKPLVAALGGLGTLILLPVIAIAACVTVIGLPLGIMLLLLLLPLYAVGYLSAALVVGRLILKQARILAFVVGIVILQLLTLIPIVGGLIGLLATIFGLGALMIALFSARS
jgi:cytoskeletal protein CcmA (bactofilin family)